MERQSTRRTRSVLVVLCVEMLVEADGPRLVNIETSLNATLCTPMSGILRHSADPRLGQTSRLQAQDISQF